MTNYINKIDNKLKELESESDKLFYFFKVIMYYEPIIIGGFIRNVINNEEIRDIDILLNTREAGVLERLINIFKFDYKINGFGGYKLFIDGYTFDIWYMKEHNLFKKSVYPRSFSNLKNTTFINYDSLVYDVVNKELDIDNYLDCVASETIDFVGSDYAIKSNEKEYLSIGKIFGICFEKNMGISERVYEYIMEKYTKDSNFIEKLKEEYRRHYGYDMSIELEEYINKFFKNDYVKIAAISGC